MRTLWMAGALGALLAGGVAGCGMMGIGESDVDKDTAALGRVPMEQKQVVFTAQNNLQIAQSNVQSADRALDEAETFREMTERQMDASKSRVDATQKAYELGQKGQSPQMIDAARAHAQLSRREFATVQAKKNFADRLVELRESQKDLAQKELNRADHELSIARVQTLQRSGYQPEEDINEMIEKRNKTLQDIAALQGRISSLDGQVNQLRTAWQQRRRSYNIAARNFPAPAIQAPQGAQQNPMQQIPMPQAPNPELDVPEMPEMNQPQPGYQQPRSGVRKQQQYQQQQQQAPDQGEELYGPVM